MGSTFGLTEAKQMALPQHYLPALTAEQYLEIDIVLAEVYRNTKVIK